MKLDRKQDLKILYKFVFLGLEYQHGCSRFWFICNIFNFSETAEHLAGNQISASSTKFVCFGLLGKTKMAALSYPSTKVAHCTQVHDMLPFGPLVLVWLNLILLDIWMLVLLSPTDNERSVPGWNQSAVQLFIHPYHIRKDEAGKLYVTCIIKCSEFFLWWQILLACWINWKLNVSWAKNFQRCLYQRQYFYPVLYCMQIDSEFACLYVNIY